jgi:hypothetical protein
VVVNTNIHMNRTARQLDRNTSIQNGAPRGRVTVRVRCIAGLIPQSLQLQAYVWLASLGWCHKSSECARSCARRSVCFCSLGGGVARIRLLS